MSEPIVFISHSRIKEGKLEDFEGLARENFSLIEQGKPGTVVFLAYTDEDGAEVHFVHAFPDADAMDRHLEGVDERAAAALEFIEIAGYEIYGSPSEQTLATMQRFATELRVPLSVRPRYLGGYLRPGPG